MMQIQMCVEFEFMILTMQEYKLEQTGLPMMLALYKDTYRLVG
jgi:hypothetical protein